MQEQNRYWITAPLVLAAGGLGVVLSVLMAAHQRPLSAGAASLRIATDQIGGGWRVQHVLVDGCPCSDAVAAHLLERGPIAGVREQVILIADDATAQSARMGALRKTGFETSVDSPQTAQRQLGVGGGPMMLVTDNAGRRLYAGGYGPGRAAADRPRDFYQDQQIIAELRAGQRVKGFPVFGCSAGQSPGQVWDQFNSVFHSGSGQ